MKKLKLLITGIILGGSILSFQLISANVQGENNHVYASEKKSKVDYKDIKDARKELKEDFKKKMKMPKKLPFSSEAPYAMTINHGDSIQYYDEVFLFNENKGRVMIRAYEREVTQIWGEYEPEEIDLKKDRKGQFLDNGVVQQIYWVDDENGVYYVISALKDKTKLELKFSKEELIAILDSFVKIK
ncbi:hypothetical protein ACFSCX_17590 [Bacillus salitolerans]|uniref:DUF4367 domain-containing protein n=1 Tax=Bacillus salitolerans TaxID=1437434 RepID=A0ABW4LU70_9BACI